MLLVLLRFLARLQNSSRKLVRKLVLGLLDCSVVLVTKEHAEHRHLRCLDAVSHIFLALLGLRYEILLVLLGIALELLDQ